jgi:Na+/H+-dicarboxylate symporter
MKKIEQAMWLLIVFILGVTVGLYWGGMTVKHRLQEAQAMKGQFFVEHFPK